MHEKSKSNLTQRGNDLLFQIVRSNAASRPTAPALRFGGDSYSYAEFTDLISALRNFFSNIGVEKNSRVAALLPNCPEAVITAFAAVELGAIFVPANPLYRSRQIMHVLHDCGASVLVTTRYLFASIVDKCRDLRRLDAVIFVDQSDLSEKAETKWQAFDWSDVTISQPGVDPTPNTELSGSDPALIFYTSGSTGRAKGVIISHSNLMDGARIVAGYLKNTGDDRIIAALPLSFDYGFSQATTILYVGGELILTNYTLPQKLLIDLVQSRATGLAGVPTMWAQLANLTWPSEIADHLRYITNSGGRLPETVLKAIRKQCPDADVFLMYGLTEAFRSSYLDPALVERFPDSIGKAIPEVGLYVVRPDGSLCEANEPGELVHTGALVALGYWNDAEATERRFRLAPAVSESVGSSTRAVWSGDIVMRNEDGFLFFVERADSMLKCSGYRISPTEIEETIYESGLVKHVAVIGIPDTFIGQRVGLAVVPKSAHEEIDFAIRYVCARELPPYMQPDEIIILEKLILTANGKPDRTAMGKLFASRPRTRAK